MAKKISQPKKKFKVIFITENFYPKILEDNLNDGYLIATDLVDSLKNTNLLVLVKNDN